MSHLFDLLPELALGTLAPAERAGAEVHLAACPACRAELEALAASIAALGRSQAARPTAALRDRVLRSASRPGPAVFADLLGRLFDLGPERAERLLSRIADPSAWRPVPLPGVEVMPVAAGAGAAGEASLVRFAPGTRFPRHRHLGREVMLVLEGGYREPGGEGRDPGDVQVMDRDTAHAIVADPREGCLAAVLLTGAIEVEGLGTLTGGKA